MTPQDIPPPFDMMITKIILGTCLGLICGSFITMLSYRLPRHLSITVPGSQCPSCHAQLTVRDLFPLLSWLLHKGRCRHCQAPISPRYPLIEIVTGALGAVAFARFGYQPLTLLAFFGIILVMTGIIIMVERHSA